MKQSIALKNGSEIPKLGMGTWYLGENKKKWSEEIAALRMGIDHGISMIDTAEMYGEGLAEQLTGEAIKGYVRRDLFLVSKVYPHNAGKKRIYKSIENTIKRLGTDYLDLYLLHWRGSVPLEETVDAMEELVKKGLIRTWGVSNFDTEDMNDLYRVPYGKNCAVNQVLYHLGSRGIEYELLDNLKAHDIAAMAYCPLAQAGELKKELLKNEQLKGIARKHNTTVLQILLAFVLKNENIAAIPRSGNTQHILENIYAKKIILDQEDLAVMNQAFPAPKHKTPLDIV